jgi:tetratricopeptide (TPR) repeat protein
MEETLEPEVVPSRDCPECGQPAMEGNHPTPLCADCRQKYVRYPIPVWIRIFGACIAALVLFSLFTFPKDLSVGINLEKGERAEKAGKYLTAQRAMEKVVQKVPGNIEAEGHLLIDAVYTQDMETFKAQYAKLKDRNIEDKELFSAIEEAMDKAGGYFVNDSFTSFMTAHPGAPPSDIEWASYFDKNPRDFYALATYASALNDRKELDREDSVLRVLLSRDKESYIGLELISSLLREEHKPDEALIYNDRLLRINQELPYGLASKARTLLMQKKDREALQLSEKACQLGGSDDIYSQSTLALAYHFNQRPADRDALIRKLNSTIKDTSDRGGFQYVLDVISNKEKFRD